MTLKATVATTRTKSKTNAKTKDAKSEGKRILKELGWPIDSGFADMDQEFWDFTTEHLFGQIWARPGLSLRERAIVTLSVLLAVDADRGSINHIRYAHNLGITEKEMREIIIQVGYYAGWPKGAHAMARFYKVLHEPGNVFVKPEAKAKTLPVSKSKATVSPVKKAVVKKKLEKK
jgi:alkylhydroperoxidase/carboxymuconolactone decarboxylase family protein YurZ